MGRFIRNSGRNCFRLEFSFDGKESLLFGDGLFFCPAGCCAALERFFLRRMEGRFLKAVLPRTGRLDYVGNKVVAVALSGFLTWLLAGVLISFGYFVVFFPMEQQGSFPVEEGREFL